MINYLKSQSIVALLALFLLSSACTFKKQDMVYVKGVSTRLHSESNTVFRPFIEKFEFYGRAEFNDPKFVVGDIPINFGDTTNPDYDGVCLIYPDGTKEIKIKESWWQRAHPIQREVMVFHELGHCRLGRTHDEGVIPFGNGQVKASIMNPVIPDATTYKEHKEGYLAELFTYSRSRLYSIMGITEN